MDIRRDPELEQKIIDGLIEREMREREGIHNSDLIYCLNKALLRRLNPKPPTRAEILLFSLGWSTQHELTGTFAPETEYEVDGIRVTPDDNLFSLPLELKATYQSSTKPISENLHWIRQIMSEAYVRKQTSAYLSRLEILGNWKWVYHPSKPETIAKIVEEFGPDWAEHPTLSGWRLDFTPEELETHWQWMKERRDLLQGMIDTKTLLAREQALASGQSWECGFCGFNGEECK